MTVVPEEAVDAAAAPALPRVRVEVLPDIVREVAGKGRSVRFRRWTPARGREACARGRLEEAAGVAQLTSATSSGVPRR